MKVTVTEAEPMLMPGAHVPWGNQREADCNSPGHWSSGQLVVFNSAGHPWRSEGTSIGEMQEAVSVTFDRPSNGGRWIEATWKSPDGALYGWYHNEPMLPIFEEVNVGRTQLLTAPRIGACRSDDDGLTWKDLGIILEVAPDTYMPETANYFFGGGNGDFSVMLDARGEYFYFVMGLYNRLPQEQGIGWARLPKSRIDDPVGAATKWCNGEWSEPGIGGRASPTIPVWSDWNGPSPDAPWGPSIHWNRHLGRYVILLNRAVDPKWKQEGIYVCTSDQLEDPTLWSEPEKILDGGGWYPVVYGPEHGDTDKNCGESARLFMGLRSNHEIRFGR